MCRSTPLPLSIPYSTKSNAFRWNSPSKKTSFLHQLELLLTQVSMERKRERERESTIKVYRDPSRREKQHASARNGWFISLTTIFASMTCYSEKSFWSLRLGKTFLWKMDGNNPWLIYNFKVAEQGGCFPRLEKFPRRWID